MQVQVSWTKGSGTASALQIDAFTSKGPAKVEFFEARFISSSVSAADKVAL